MKYRCLITNNTIVLLFDRYYEQTFLSTARTLYYQYVRDDNIVPKIFLRTYSCKILWQIWISRGCAFWAVIVKNEWRNWSRLKITSVNISCWYLIFFKQQFDSSTQEVLIFFKTILIQGSFRYEYLDHKI